MNFTWEGRDYSYDPSKIDVQTAMAIKLYTGYGLKSWNAAVEDMEPMAVQALLFAVKAQNGEACEMSSIEISIVDFMHEFAGARLAEIKAQLEAEKLKKPDPTRPASGAGKGSTRKQTRT